MNLLHPPPGQLENARSRREPVPVACLEQPPPAILNLLPSHANPPAGTQPRAEQRPPTPRPHSGGGARGQRVPAGDDRFPVPGHLWDTNPVRNHPSAMETRRKPPGGRLQRTEGASGSVSRPSEVRSADLTAAGFYFYSSIQAKIFKYPSSPQRISLRLVPDLLMKTLRKQKKTPPPSPSTTPASPRSPRPYVLLHRGRTSSLLLG